MTRPDLPSSESEDPRRERRDNLIGLVVSAILSALAFALVIAKPFGREWETIGLAVLALAQIACQLRFFLHIDLRRSHRDDLQLVLFTTLVIGLMVAGSLWILFNQHARMG